MQRDHDKLVDDFKQVMLLKLNQNKNKQHWSELSNRQLLLLLKAEVAELEEAIEKNHDKYDIAFECADVANFSAFIADNVLSKY